MKNSPSNYKWLLRMTLFVGLLCAMPQQTEAQILKRLIKKAEKKVEREVEKRAESRINKKIDEEFDKVEDEIDGKNKKDKKAKDKAKKSSSKDKNTTNTNGTTNPAIDVASIQPQLGNWNRFDFVPGDEVIFEDTPSIHEESGEFPSRWDLEDGNVEIMEFGGETVIGFPQGGTMIPYLKNRKEDYLPEVFTLEMDVYFRPEYARRLWISFYDEKNQDRNGLDKATIYVNGATLGSSNATIPEKKSNYDKAGGWRHISVAFTKGKMKIYHDQIRLINIPHFEGNPTGITIQMDGYSSDKPKDLQFIKNIRIAKGGVKYYDRVMSEGKIIVNGIKFDVNKASLKPESMGAINKIFKLMQNQANLNFSVEGHTDSDGKEDANQTLSEARAKAVMNQLISMGIATERLTSKGFGESKPLDNNSTPEGKANNRRVEFVKF